MSDEMIGEATAEDLARDAAADMSRVGGGDMSGSEYIRWAATKAIPAWIRRAVRAEAEVERLNGIIRRASNGDVDDLYAEAEKHQ